MAQQTVAIINCEALTMYQSVCSTMKHCKAEISTTPAQSHHLTKEIMPTLLPATPALHSTSRIMKKSMQNLWCNPLRYFAMLLLLCGYSTAFAGLRDVTPDTKNRGEQIFKATCSVCHGEKGSGAIWGKLNPPPRNFTSPESYAKLTRERMINSVTYGRTGTAMQPFASQLTPSDIEAVVDYILKTFIANATTADMSLPFPKGLKGNRVRGGFLFHANCAPCHGQSGDGKGDRAYFINPKPRNFLLPASRRWLNRPALFEIISKGSLGTDMPSWDKVLDDQEIADVAEHVFQKFINPNKPIDKTENSKK